MSVSEMVTDLMYTDLQPPVSKPDLISWHSPRVYLGAFQVQTFLHLVNIEHAPFLQTARCLRNVIGIPYYTSS
jgi:hypothetical protein